MQQRIMNICVNARDAMPAREKLPVTTRTVPWQIPFLVSRPDVRHGRYAEMTFADTGVRAEDFSGRGAGNRCTQRPREQES